MKSGDEQTDVRHVWKQLPLPAGIIGWPSGLKRQQSSIMKSAVIFRLILKPGDERTSVKMVITIGCDRSSALLKKITLEKWLIYTNWIIFSYDHGP